MLKFYFNLKHTFKCFIRSKDRVPPQNVLIAAKCNTNAKCNNFSTQNVVTFLTHNVITQNVIQVGTRSQSTKSEVYSIFKYVFKCIQADY